MTFCSEGFVLNRYINLLLNERIVNVNNKEQLLLV
jgi:hypothetical protein